MVCEPLAKHGMVELMIVMRGLKSVSADGFVLCCLYYLVSLGKIRFAVVRGPYFNASPRVLNLRSSTQHIFLSRCGQTQIEARTPVALRFS